MTLRFVVVLTLATAACGKTSDVGAMQDEALGLVASYKTRFDGLERRLQDIDARSKRVPREAISAASDLPVLQKVAGETTQKLNEMKSFVQQAPNSIAAAAKGGNPRAELIKLTSEIGERLEVGYREVNANLDTVESWISNVELRPKVVAAAPAPPTPTPTPTPTPEVPDPGRGPSD